LVATSSLNIPTKALLGSFVAAFIIFRDCLGDDRDIILKLIREMWTENMIEFNWFREDSFSGISAH
jgi:hypothetical protein